MTGNKVKPYPLVDEFLRPILRVAMPRARRLTSVPLTDDAVAAQDRVCLAVAHSKFDLGWIVKGSRTLIDATGMTRFLNGDQSHVIRL